MARKPRKPLLRPDGTVFAPRYVEESEEVTQSTDDASELKASRRPRHRKPASSGHSSSTDDSDDVLTSSSSSESDSEDDTPYAQRTLEAEWRYCGCCCVDRGIPDRLDPCVYDCGDEGRHKRTGLLRCQDPVLKELLSRSMRSALTRNSSKLKWTARLSGLFELIKIGVMTFVLWTVSASISCPTGCYEDTHDLTTSDFYSLQQNCRASVWCDWHEGELGSCLGTQPIPGSKTLIHYCAEHWGFSSYIGIFFAGYLPMWVLQQLIIPVADYAT